MLLGMLFHLVYARNLKVGFSFFFVCYFDMRYIVYTFGRRYAGPFHLFHTKTKNVIYQFCHAKENYRMSKNVDFNFFSLFWTLKCSILAHPVAGGIVEEIEKESTQETFVV